MTAPTNQATASDAPATSSTRLLSLDVFRGLTILGMILVNNPGDWGSIYAPLEHAAWHGWTPTDLIFPFFLFIVGTSLAFSLKKYREGAAIDPAVYTRIIRRTLVLIALGLGLGLFGRLCDIWIKGESGLHFDTLRWPGVLQRIALVYFAASLIVLHVNTRGQVALAAALLLGYWGILAWLPAGGSYADRLSPEGNVVRQVDRVLIGENHMYTRAKSEKTDPEGLLSTLPAIVTALLGYWTGLVIQRGGKNYRTVNWLIVGGMIVFAVGLAWNQAFPINKKIWTSSFVLTTGGLAAVGLGLCLALFDVAGYRRFARPFEIVGVNAIFVFVASGMLARFLGTKTVQTAAGEQSLHGWIYENVFTNNITEPKLASLACALATIAFWWLILWAMSRRGWAIRV